jgi:hypothetical protein
MGVGWSGIARVLLMLSLTSPLEQVHSFQKIKIIFKEFYELDVIFEYKQNIKKLFFMQIIYLTCQSSFIILLYF